MVPEQRHGGQDNATGTERKPNAQRTLMTPCLDASMRSTLLGSWPGASVRTSFGVSFMVCVALSASLKAAQAARSTCRQLAGTWVPRPEVQG